MSMIRNVLRNLVSTPATRRYPEVKRPPVPGFRGPLQIDASKCIMCSMCQKVCPSQCITVDANAGTWDLDVLECVYCASCVEVCPTKCLSMSDEHAAPRFAHDHLTVEPTGRKKKPQAE